MRVLTAKGENFASYKDISFDYTSQGLTLIQGPNGAGKSTLADLVPWVLYGKTAKGGNVEAVLPWGSNEAAQGFVTVETAKGTLTVSRTRSPKKENDLWFSYDGEPTRGKDITDTQKLLNAELGLDYQTYLTGAYAHEFSATASFFSATPKVRRTICDQIIDLSMVDRVQKQATVKKKQLKEALSEAMSDYENILKTMNRNDKDIVDFERKAKTFDQDKKNEIDILNQKYRNFKGDLELDIYTTQISLDVGLANLDRGSSRCGECGAWTNEAAKEADRLRGLKSKLDLMKVRVNPYELPLKLAKAKTNTYAAQADSLTIRNQDLHAEASSLHKDAIVPLAEALSDIEQLLDLIGAFRGELILSTIKGLEHSTNDLLTQFFDSEIQVDFVVDEDVDVNIRKNGNECAYSQLSKGQRQLLKLCFSVAIMKQTANHHGVKFSHIMFDEALDGLDDDKKTRAHALLTSLTLDYESVFVVEHSSVFKSLTDNQYSVSLLDSLSVITKE